MTLLANHGGLWPSKLVACKYRAVEGLVGKTALGILGEEPRW